MTLSTTSDPFLDRDEVLALLQGEIEPVKKSPLYAIGLFLVAVVMILLPVIYVGLIGLVGYLTFLHATGSVSILEGSGLKFRLLMYLGPIVAGAVVCLFLVKPLFARPPRSPRPLSLDAASEPLLFAWVERLSRLVGAPMPRRIDVNCEVNASASFRRGLLSMIGRDLVLTIGIPLAAGMTLRQFTGVLAHEFGHFSQGGGMRLSYIIRSVNHWFARVVYERDSMDVALDESQQNSAIVIMLVVGVSRGCVWLSRRILWVLMQIGHLISCFLLRQMEYDADRYEARVAGSEVFGETVNRLHSLMIGQSIAMEEMELLWSEKKLPDDLPTFCLAKAEKLDEKSLQEYMAGVMDQKTSRWSSHPADRDRIDSAMRERTPGLLQTDLPATLLISDFEDLSRRVSSAHYDFILGGRVDRRYINPTSELLGAQEEESERRLGLLRYFQGRIDGKNTFFPSPDPTQAEADANETRVELDRIRVGLLESRGSELEKRRDLVDRRLQLALKLLEIPDVASVLDPNQASDKQARELLAVLHCLHRIHPSVKELAESFQTVIRQLQLLQQSPDKKMNRYGFQEALEQLHSRYMSIRAELDAISYPFSHMDGEISCAGYAAPATPTLDEPGAVIESTQQLLDLLRPLYQKTLARLVEIAERAEDAIGLKRLEAPTIEEVGEEEDENQQEAKA